MKLLIVTYVHSHQECIGFLLELLHEKHDITVNYYHDQYNYVDYFKKLYNFVEKKSIGFDETKYDKIIKLTSTENLHVVQIHKLIGINHMSEREFNLRRAITLTPLIKIRPQTKNLCVLPIYKGYYTLFPEKHIVYIGYFLKSYLDSDLQNFISNVSYHFTFIVWGDTNYDFTQYPNVTLRENVKTDEMVEILNKSSFVLCRKYPYQINDRYSGSITLGLSHKVPLILQTNQKREIPSMNFEKDYSELIETLNTLTEKKYNDLKEKMNFFIENQISKDKKNLEDFLYI